MNHTSLLPAVVAALVNAAVWGIAWYPLQWLQAHGVPSMWTTIFVFAACSSLVLAVRPGALQRLLAAPQLFWVCLASGLTNVCFNLDAKSACRLPSEHHRQRRKSRNSLTPAPPRARK